MDNRDEEFTLENVDEQVEHLLAWLQASHPPKTFLARTIRNLQIIYKEDRRLENAWTRINNAASTLKLQNVPIAGPSNGSKEGHILQQPTGQDKIPMESPEARWKRARETDEPMAIRPFQQEQKTWQESTTMHAGSFDATRHKSAKQSPQPRRWSRRNLGIVLVAAIVLIIICALPVLSSAFRDSSRTATKTATPPARPTENRPAMKEYANRYFTIRYPTNWVISGTTSGGTGPYLQTVQFRPAATSSVEVNVDVLPTSGFSADQLLHMDADAKLGTLGGAGTVIQHGVPWRVGIVNLAGSARAPVGKLEIAYSKQGNPYRIKFGATPGMFEKYAPIFNTMFASFYAQAGSIASASPTATSPAASPTVTPAPTITPTPTAMPSPTGNVPDTQEYSGQYFTIQYPAGWVITSVTNGGTYLQTVQFRPSVTSPVFVNVNALYSNDLTADLLLLIDPDVKLGTLLSTSTVTYHGIPWVVGTVNLGAGPAQPSKLEVAYSNQKAPYRIEFGAPPGMFDAYTTTFNAMFASFYPTNP